MDLKKLEDLYKELGILKRRLDDLNENKSILENMGEITVRRRRNSNGKSDFTIDKYTLIDINNSSSKTFAILLTSQLNETIASVEKEIQELLKKGIE